MDTRSPEAQRILDRIDQQTVDALRRGEAAERVQAQVAALTQTATSRGREVSVTVDSQGRLTGIVFSDAAYRLSPRQLSETVLRTVGQARAQAEQRIVELAGREFGDQSAITDMFRAHYSH